LLTGVDVYITALPCEEDGTPLLDPETSPVIPRQQSDNWTPYKNRITFELADFLYRREQMSGGNTDILLELWAASLACYNDSPPFSDHQNLYDTIDATPIGGVPWQNITLSYDGPCPEPPPLWMESEYTIWFRDPRLLFKTMLENPDFARFFDYTPYQQYDNEGKRRYEHFMSGNWAWKQAVRKFSS
jgi:Plavaka transposase